MSTVTLTADEYEELVRAAERAEARVVGLQKLLDTLTTPNVSYFDMTPAEEIARLEARLQEGQSVLKRRCEECDRYRAALEKIIDLNAGSFPLPWDTQNIARAALKPAP